MCIRDSVYAEAEQAGSNGNIGLGCAVVPVSVPTEIETVTNREKFTGGCEDVYKRQAQRI